MASPKYSSIQVYNKGHAPPSERLDGDQDEEETDDCVISGFCDEKTENEMVEILMKNISSIPIKL